MLPEHLLIKLMEEGSNGDLEHIFHFFNINQDAVWHELLDFLNRQPAGNQSKPVFSRRLYEWLERAWLSANVQHKSDWITGAALIDALTELLPYSPVLQLPALLEKIDARFMAENLDKLCQNSSERLNHRQNKVLSILLLSSKVVKVVPLMSIVKTLPRKRNKAKLKCLVQ